MRKLKNNWSREASKQPGMMLEVIANANINFLGFFGKSLKNT